MIHLRSDWGAGLAQLDCHWLRPSQEVLIGPIPAELAVGKRAGLPSNPPLLLFHGSLLDEFAHQKDSHALWRVLYAAGRHRSVTMSAAAGRFGSSRICLL